MKAINRRQFLKSSITAAMTAGVSGVIPHFGTKVFASVGKIDLAVVKNGGPKSNVRKAVELLGGMSKYVKRGQTVLVKPNMAWDRSPEQAANTNPDVMAEVVRLCYEAGAKKVKVLDKTCHNAKRAYRKSGIERSCKDADAEVRFVHESRFEKVEISGGEILTSWTFYRDALESDVVINVPIAKHHSISRLTLGFKNIMGLIGDNRGDIHNKFSTKIVDLNMVIRPQLTIIDATRILLHNGPTGGSLADVDEKDTIIVSEDRVAADAYSASSLFEIDPNEMEYLRIASQRGLGVMDLKNLAIKQIDLKASG